MRRGTVTMNMFLRERQARRNFWRQGVGFHTVIFMNYARSLTCRRGKVMVHVVPSPSSLRISIVP